MLDTIIAELNARKELAGWTVRHIITRGAQVYAVPSGIEAEREVSDEKYRIDVLRNTKAADGSAAMGGGPTTLLPGGDIRAAIFNPFVDGFTHQQRNALEQGHRSSSA